MTSSPRKPVDETPLSVVDLFTIGIGPSSSHTVGPMRAGYRFCEALKTAGLFDQVLSVRVELFGSLALTGVGHATDTATLLGLSGQRPRTVDPDKIDTMIETIRTTKKLVLGGVREIDFDIDFDLVFNFDQIMEEHPNAMRLRAFGEGNSELLSEDYFSVGGGFVVSRSQQGNAALSKANVTVPFPFTSADELLAHGAREGLSIAGVMRANERAWRTDEETDKFLGEVRDAMNACITRGCKQTGILPGTLRVPRRAHQLYHDLISKPEAAMKDPLTVLDWVNLFALAVNEENAAGGRVVTAPTNGASGIVPAVLAYYERFCPSASPKGSQDFLLTAAAIGVLYKKRASISGAEVGCQGEVGVACSMAAAALTAVLGGSNAQVENAAEIGMEHNLGLTCDPVGGLVQVPCIERNGLGAIKAVSAASLALRGDGKHFVPLDSAIETMRQTGHDMHEKYKETSLGGLAVNVPNC